MTSQTLLSLCCANLLYMLTWRPVLLLLLPQGMGMSPEMMTMMNQMDFSQEKVQQQFSELGLKPEDVIQKVSQCIE
jgi:hypothetical protein